uniref:Uncharacterized protein n=1 Tax=Flavobacterium pectinovorum TaxID=29533 RepID=A0A502F7J9_9FLAO
MRKIIFLLLISFITINSIKSQNIYYDAKYLNNRLVNKTFKPSKITSKTEDSLILLEASIDKQINDHKNQTNILTNEDYKKIQNQRKEIKNALLIIDQKKIDTLFTILKRYFPEINENTAPNSISEILSKNPFFNGFEIESRKEGGGKLFTDNNLSSVTNIGGLDVTKYANAISDLMIERAKQELTIAFFNRFRKFADKNPEFKILFPKTTDNLANLLTYTYPQMLPALRNSFFEDIKQITYHLDDVLQLPKYQKLFENFPEVRVAIRSINLIHTLESNEATAADIIKDFSQFEEFETINDTASNYSKAFKNLGASVKLGAIFSESLREPDTTKNKIWITMKQAQEMLKDKVFFKIYMGLIYQQCEKEKIIFYLGKSNLDFAKNVLAVQKDDLLIFKSKVTEMITLGAKVNETLANLKAKDLKKEKLSNDDIYNYVNVSIDMIEYSQNIAKIFNTELLSDNYLLIAKKSNALYKDIYSEKYTQAVNDAVDILKNIHDLVKSNTAVGIDKKTNLDSLFIFVEKVRPYALFMGNTVEAKTEEQIKAALDNAMLPVGSSTIKKYTENWGNVSIQSYLGAYYNFSSSSTTIPSAWTDKFGVIAPIGISWTPGFLSWKRGGALSIFAPLLDIGAIVDYKLEKEDKTDSNGSTEPVIVKEYKIELGQIFCPGGYLVYGFPWDLPLSFGVGGQYGPGLSKINVDGTTVVGNPSWRWNMFLAVDIPFFNLMNHNKVRPIE